MEMEEQEAWDYNSIENRPTDGVSVWQGTQPISRQRQQPLVTDRYKTVNLTSRSHEGQIDR